VHLPVKARDLPGRVTTGAYILHSGLDKWRADEARATALHGMASGAFPVLNRIPPTRFLRLLAASEIAAKKLSVREAEKLATKIGTARQKPLLRVKTEKPRDIRRIEEELSDALTATVEIRVKKRGRSGEQGEVAIAFGSLDELNGLLEKLGLSRS